MQTVILRRVRIGFAKFNTPIKFNENDPNEKAKYKGSFLIESDSIEHRNILAATENVLKQHDITNKTPEQALSKQLKEDPEYANKQSYMDPAKCLFFWCSAKYMPKISTVHEGRMQEYVVKDSDKEAPAEDAIPDHFKVYGGDLVLAYIRIEYFPKYKNMGFWPQSIHIVEHSSAKFGDPEWQKAIEEDQDAKVKSENEKEDEKFNISKEN